MAKNPGKNDKPLWKHWLVNELIKAALLGIVFLIVVSVTLKFITRHNQEIIVPDLSGLSVEDAKKAAKAAHLKIDVTDSMYFPKLPKGTVFRQSPLPGNLVKKNRRILLTINSIEAKKVVMPSVIGYSLRQAKAELAVKNLHVGRLIYVKDMATNNVLSQSINGRYVSAGSMVDAESEIDLELGLSSDMETTFIPNVTGLSIINAKDILIDNSLNIGKIYYDATIKGTADSLISFVIRQDPEASEFSTWSLGTKVNLYLSTDKSLLEKKNTPKE